VEERVAGIDLGEVHMAVSHDGAATHILNGRLLRSKRQYQNKLKAKLQHRIATKKRGSKRHKRLVKSKQRQLGKLKHQIKEVEHKQTTRLISTLHREGVQTLVIGDVRDIRQENDVGSTNNQKIQCAASAPVELPIMGRRLRVDNLLGYRPYLAGKTQRGKEHGRKAAKHEDM
jgi:putative transposase